jgi:peroxiredoxin
MQKNSNKSTILDFDLALENYLDDNNKSFPLLDEVIQDVNNFRGNKKNLSEAEQKKEEDKIIKKYNQVLNIIGRYNFIFDDYGNINYIWKSERKKNEEWRNKSQKFKAKRLFKISLAFESYGDDNKENFPDLDKVIEDHNLFYDKEDKLSEKELTKEIEKLLTEYDKVLDIVGRDKFIFYNDGDVNYIWKEDRK